MSQKKQPDCFNNYSMESFTLKIEDRLLLFDCFMHMKKCIKINLRFSSLPVNENNNTPIKSELMSFISGNINNISYLFDLTCNDKQLMVYNELLQAPFGKTTTYSDLSNKTGIYNPRLVGKILSKNPLPIVIPCHRVIGKDNTLKGYAFGLEMKQFLLYWESKNL